MIKTVLFDFDGTIADTFSTIVRLFNLHSYEFRLPKLTSREIDNFRSLGLREVLYKYKLHLFKLPFIAKKIRDKLNKKIKQVKTFPNIQGVLFKLKENQVRLGILSSNSKENIEKFLRANDLMIFDFIHSESNIFGKGRALKTLLKNYRLKKNEVIYIGDEVRDIEACHENGVKIVSVTWGFNKKEILKKNKPDYLIDNPQEILKMISI